MASFSYAERAPASYVSDSPAMPALIEPGSADDTAYGFLSQQIASGEADDAADVLENTVNQIEAIHHRYHEDLIVPLTLLGDARMAQQDFDAALDLYTRARHVARVSHGLFDTRQLAVVYREADVLIAAGDLQSAAKREEYAYEVMRKAYPNYDPATLPGLMRLGDFYLNTFNYLSARAIYNAAMNVHSSNQTDFSLEAIPALRGIAISHRLERFPPIYIANPDQSSLDGPTPGLRSPEFDRQQMVFNNFPAGEKALQQIIEIHRRQEPENRAETLKAIIELADWHLIFGRSNMANTLYSDVYRQMLDSGADAASFFAQPTLIYLPMPENPRPPPADMRAEPADGLVTLSFDVAPTGRIRKLVTVDSQPEKLMDFRVRRSMRLAVFRPQLIDGLPVVAEAQTYTHEFRYFPKLDPTAAVINPASPTPTEESCGQQGEQSGSEPSGEQGGQQGGQPSSDSSGGLPGGEMPGGQPGGMPGSTDPNSSPDGQTSVPTWDVEQGGAQGEEGSESGGSPGSPGGQGTGEDGWETSNEIPGTPGSADGESGEAGSGQAGAPGEENGGTPSGDDELDGALKDFDGEILAEREIISSSQPGDAQGGGGASTLPSGSESQGQGSGGDVASTSGPLPPRRQIPSAPPPPPRSGESGPENLPDARDDDIIARQLREAAMQETDPELKESVNVLAHPLLTLALPALLLLGGCVNHTTRIVDMTPPEQSERYLDENELLDVGISIFDANVPEDYDERIEEIILPEVRRAESQYVPFFAKNLLQSTGNWGAVRVVPRPTHAVDIMVTGTIVHSNGESMIIEATVSDATGEQWFSREYSALASKYAYEEGMPESIDAFQAVYKNLADDMLAYRQGLSPADIERIRKTAELKFAREFSQEAFADHVVKNEDGQFEIVRLPAENDPMLERVRRVREREYLFIDTLDEYYSNFHRQMYPAYQDWRRASYDQAIAYQELRAQARSRMIGGTMAIIGGVAAMYESSDAYVDASGIVGVVAGATLITSAVQKRHEAEQQADRLRELGSAAEAELVPTTIELENQTLRLQGNVDQQYTELRRILKRVYFEDLGLAPLSHLQEKQDKHALQDVLGLLDWRGYTTAAVVLVVLIGAFYWLPQRIVEPNNTQAATASSVSDNAPVPTTDNNALAPFADAQQARAREKVQQALAEFVERQILLEDTMQVDQWGADALDAAMMQAKEGDGYFVDEAYDSALAAYQQAVISIDAVISQGNQLHREFLHNGDAALLALDPTAAEDAFNQALTIKPDDADAKTGLARAQGLPAIISMLRSAKNHELGGRYDEALAIYNDIGRLDPLTPNLPELRAAANAAKTGDDVASHISRGFSALQRQQFEQARSAFNAALSLDSDNAVARGGLQQVAEQYDLAVISKHQKKAELAMAQEQWLEAVDAYQSVLKLDKNIQFAKQGLAQAKAHEKAQRLMTRIVNEPTKLSNEKLYLDAQTIAQQAQQLEYAGDELQRLQQEVNKLLSLYADPVDVILLSDNATNIVMSNVGELGLFERRTISLRPGAYTIRGSQNGCRDIFLTVEVLPGIEPLDVRGVYLLREGKYEISAQTPLYEPLQEAIRVGSERNQRIALEFVPLPGFLTLQLSPADASIEINGQPEQVTPRLELAAGQHEITVSHPRYISNTLTVVMQGKQIEQSERIELAPNWADVAVTSQPAGASIWIDNQPTGLQTPATIEALAGEREVSIRLEGYKTHRERIFAQAGLALSLAPVDLEQADAAVTVTSRPQGAGVTVNGRFMGQTPLELDLKSAQRHNLQIILNGYATFNRSLQLKRGDIRSVHADLVRQTGEIVVRSQPAGALLTINGKPAGAADQVLTLPVEPHDISISLDGYAGYSTEITPKAGLVQEVRVRLLTLAEARLAALTPSITTAAGQNLKLFEPFEFRMGASRREPGRRANETLRDVKMTRLFYLATQEVTNAQFRQFASGHDSGLFEEVSLNEDDMPVASVSWNDAAAYCNWLSDKDGLPQFYNMEFGKVTGVNLRSTGYRMPTEAEWSWAARTQPRTKQDPTDVLRFPWGDNLPPPDRHGNYADRAASALVGRVIFGYNDNHTAASPVGTFKSNIYGLYDMGGNVAEWTNDFYEIASADPVTDPAGPASGEYRVIKGASWMHGTITELRYSFRDYGIGGRQASFAQEQSEADANDTRAQTETEEADTKNVSALIIAVIIVHLVYVTIIRPNADVSEAVKSVCEAESDRLDSELSMVRYIAWAIPSIGFIGTVRGIGEALGQAYRAVEGDIAGVTTSLGVAFNSTFIALVISIVLMFLVHQLQLIQERLVLDTHTYCDQRLLRHLQPHQAARTFTGAAAQTPNGLIFDDDALARSRSHPQQFNNRYLSTIAADPVAGDLGLAKNHADLIYRHLLQLDLPASEPLVLAVSGQISNAQLGLLLGICAEAQLTVKGFIDLALGQSLSIPADTGYHVLDVEQHRISLAEIQIRDGIRVQTRTTAIDGVGTASIIEGWMNVIADEFVQKTRFDPLHSGQTEQHLFDQVYPWLTESQMQDHVVSISNGESSREVEITAARLLEKLTQRLAGVELGQVDHLVLTPRAASIPALKSQLEQRVQQCSVVLESDILGNYEQLAASLSDAQVKRISQAANIGTRRSNESAADAFQENPHTQALAPNTLATHWLLQHTAYPLDHPTLTAAGVHNGSEVAAGTQVTVAGQTYTAIRVT
ncbi:Sumf1 [Symbiodinium pilosum]|uniref:Sumf1 protein n=1 Tax=Symbiodinium pilosum TaxID=2952 RepID=A0A812S4D0_SYMPI|nr:Sumf1 [Symbiodinium pilosum]